MKIPHILLLAFISFNSFGQEAIEGHVLDEKGKPLESASVSIKNSGIGTVTDEKGFFYLALGSEYLHDTISFSMLGYAPALMPVEKVLEERKFKVKLTEMEYMLGEIVVSKEDGGKLVKDALKNLPKNYNLKSFNMLSYYTSKHLIDGKVVDFIDAIVDIPDPGFDMKKAQPLVKSLKVRETEYKGNKGFKNWMDDAGYGFIFLLLENNYVKTKNSLLDKSGKYQIDSLYKSGDEEIYSISTYQKPYYLTTNPKNATFTAQLIITSKEKKIIKIYEDEEVETSDKLSTIQWKKNSSKDVVSAITRQKIIVEYKEWNGKLYMSQSYNECVVKDFKASTGEVLFTNTYISTLTVNEIYLGAKPDEAKRSKYVSNFWDGYILKRGINLEFF